MTSNAIVSEVVKYLELLPLNLQRLVLNFVRQLSSTGLKSTPERDADVSVSEVVARIKAMPPNLAMIIQPSGSLADALRTGPTHPEFDLPRWEQEWAAAEDELNRLNFESDVAEGRI